MDQLTQICIDLFSAGSETTSNSIAFAILHLLRNPECQDKVHKELDDVIGQDRFPSFSDKQRFSLKNCYFEYLIHILKLLG